VVQRPRGRLPRAHSNVSPYGVSLSYREQHETRPALLAAGGAGAAVMLKATQTIPIVFVIVPDPMGGRLL